MDICPMEFMFKAFYRIKIKIFNLNENYVSSKLKLLKKFVFASSVN